MWREWGSPGVRFDDIDDRELGVIRKNLVTHVMSNFPAISLRLSVSPSLHLTPTSSPSLLNPSQKTDLVVGDMVQFTGIG